MRIIIELVCVGSFIIGFIGIMGFLIAEMLLSFKNCDSKVYLIKHSKIGKTIGITGLIFGVTIILTIYITGY